MMLQNIFESSVSNVLVILPGRFQPWHKGHKAVYTALVKRFGIENVWIATSDKVEPPRSPFNFAEKLEMIKLTGIDPNRVVKCKNPYQAQEITVNFDPLKTILIFAVSEKDMAEDPRFTFGPKKDGSPSYLQPFVSVDKCLSLDKTGYVLAMPTVEFTVLGQPMKSATSFRENFAKANDATKKQMIKDLFGAYTDSVFTLMKSKIKPQIAESLDIDTAIQFHDKLNPKLWNNDRLHYVVEEHLNDIAEFFIKTLDVPDLNIVDITISGSNAAYTYTPHSDIDLHIVIDVPKEDQPIMRQLVDAKKNIFNQKHNITIRGHDVEVYVQFKDQPHESMGIYSLLKDEWLKFPSKTKPASIDDGNVKEKIRFLTKAINFAINTNNVKFAERLATKIGKYRKEGLAENGEFGVENLVFKILRNAGYLDRLSKFRQEYWDKKFTLEEIK